MSRRRVVITGLGAITPIGNTAAETWEAALAGKSGGNRIEAFDVENYAVQIGASIKGFDITQYMDPKESRRLDDFIQLGLSLIHI